MQHKGIHGLDRSQSDDFATFVFEQGDGSSPRTMLDIASPGEKGFSISAHRFENGAHLSAVPLSHLIVIQPHRIDRMRCRIAEKTLEHHSPDWNVTICPAGVRAEATCDGGLDVLILSLPVETVAFAAWQTTGRSFTLRPQLQGHDPRLKQFVQGLSSRTRSKDVAEALWWDQTTDILVAHLLSHYAGVSVATHSPLTPRQISTIHRFIRENVSLPMTVETLATTIGYSRAHFTRAFASATGLTPHYVVMRTRLSHAHNLLRRGDCSPAAAAAAAGFVDQSHLAAWTRRLFGATTGQMLKHQRRLGRSREHKGTRTDTR